MTRIIPAIEKEGFSNLKMKANNKTQMSEDDLHIV